jgi:hypothetical protein
LALIRIEETGSAKDTFKTTEVAQKPLKKEMLNSDVSISFVLVSVCHITTTTYFIRSMFFFAVLLCSRLRGFRSLFMDWEKGQQ